MEDKILELMDSAQKAIVKVAPQAFDLAIQHEKWCGLGSVGLGFGLLIVAFFFGVLGIVLIKKYWSALADSDCGFVLAFAPGASIVLFVLSLTQLLNPWNWVAIFSPKIALFHDLIEKFLNH